MRDWEDVSGTLTRANEGTYALARERSSIQRRYTRAFPDNTEIDVSLTFATQGRPGNTVAAIVPDGRAFTLRQHISFVRLPDYRYRPRPLDPRAGFFGIDFKDFAQPIQNWLEQRWISRHRLQRANRRSPAGREADGSTRRGIPKNVDVPRSKEQALGGGFIRPGGAAPFASRIYPNGDPMDARYNSCLDQRNERGWSSALVRRPRTGEMIRACAK